jgi:predicted Zn-dependent protease
MAMGSPHHQRSDIDALCMAGGKILVSSAFVRQLALTDGELGTLLAHEVAHVVAEHPRETFSEAMLLNRLPAVPLEVVMARLDSDLSLQIRLAGLSSLQESEADQLGMMLAHRAGWAAADMVSFYRKLAGSEQSALVSSAYPATASRVSMAQGMARLLTTELIRACARAATARRCRRRSGSTRATAQTANPTSGSHTGADARGWFRPCPA